MATGKTHQRITKQLVIPCSVIVVYTLRDVVDLKTNLLYSIFIAFGILSGLFIHPDLDLLETSIRSKLRTNNMFYKYWYIRWYKYSLIASHRGVISHSILLSTLLRMLYIFPESALLFILIAKLLYFDQSAIFIFTLYIMWGVGLLISDLGHIMTDYIYSYTKKVKRGKQSNRSRRKN